MATMPSRRADWLRLQSPIPRPKVLLSQASVNRRVASSASGSSTSVSLASSTRTAPVFLFNRPRCKLTTCYFAFGAGVERAAVPAAGAVLPARRLGLLDCWTAPAMRARDLLSHVRSWRGESGGSSGWNRPPRSTPWTVGPLDSVVRPAPSETRHGHLWPSMKRLPAVVVAAPPSRISRQTV